MNVGKINHSGKGAFDTLSIDTSNSKYYYIMEKEANKWLKEYYYDNNKKVKSIKISQEPDSSSKTSMPSLLGIKLNMDCRIINNTFKRNNYSIASQQFDNYDNYYIDRYIVINDKTYEAYDVKITINSKDDLVKSIEAYIFIP